MDLSPQRAYYCAELAGERIKKSPRWDNDEGVAATVGTIMALLVFLTFMGLFTNQFVPVWMSDNESAHMSTAIQQFVTLKSQVDISISHNANTRVAPTPVFVPITLSASGIPVFAGPTAGVLEFSPETFGVLPYLVPYLDVTYTYKSTTSGTERTYSLNSSNDGHSGGDLDLYCPNRYYVEQHLTYEAGAIILNQSDGEFIVAGPQILVRNMGTAASPNLVMMLTQITLEGTNKTVGGVGSKGVNADLTYAETKTYENAYGEDGNPATLGQDLVLRIATKHGVAWENYFNRTLTSLFNLTHGINFNINKTVATFEQKTMNYWILTVTVHNVTVLDHTRAIVSMSVGELGV